MAARCGSLSLFTGYQEEASSLYIEMKVGILTFHSGLNHGGFLQAYCLASEVKGLGAEVDIINYKNPQHFQADKFNPWVYRNPFNLLFNWRKKRAFEGAFSKMPLTHFTTDVDEVSWGQYDALIVGSDIVWNYQAKPLGQDPVYFGGLSKAFHGKLISYAPSCGQMPWDFDLPDSIKESMKRYSAVSARDGNTQQFARKHTEYEDVPLVVDPTWLNVSDRAQGSMAKPRQDYILLYAYSVPDAYVKAIKQYVDKEGLIIIGTGYYQRFADKQYSSASPFDWVDLIAGARCVVAGTFHAALYAIRESVPFVVIPQDAINTKLKGPLRITELNHHVLSSPDDLRSVLDCDVDFVKVQKSISGARNYSLAYLKDSLFTE